MPHLLAPLTLAGLIPFLAGAGLFVASKWPGMPAPWPTYAAFSSLATIGYGVTILCFMAGTRWGLALPDRAGPSLQFLGAVLFSLLGWAALLVYFYHGTVAAQLLSAGFLVLWIWDELAYARARVPDGYLGLRRFATVGAIASLQAIYWADTLLLGY